LNAGSVSQCSGSGTARREKSQRYGISVVGNPGGISDSIFTANMLQGNHAEQFHWDNTAGNNNLISNNKGYATMNSGTDTGIGSEQTISHSLSATPTIVLLSNIDEGANPYQSSPADVNNIHITASNGKKYQWVTMVR
jgi:hypothetical protein